MEDDVVPRDQALHEGGIADVAALDGDARQYVLGQVVEPATGAEGVVLGKRRHLGLRRDERLDEVRPDEYVRPGHENRLAGIPAATGVTARQRFGHGAAVLHPCIPSWGIP